MPWDGVPCLVVKPRIEESCGAVLRSCGVVWRSRGVSWVAMLSLRRVVRRSRAMKWHALSCGALVRSRAVFWAAVMWN